MKIKIKQKGDFSKTMSFLEKVKHDQNLSIVEKYGKIGVEALRNATPVDTGLTAASWTYEVIDQGNTIILQFHNTNVNNYVNVALILDTGHGTGTGGWVEGRNYIEPALMPIFDEIVQQAWGEVVRA